MFTKTLNAALTPNIESFVSNYTHDCRMLVCDFYSIILPLQPKVIPSDICGICQKGKEANKKGKPEALIHCSECENSGKFTHSTPEGSLITSVCILLQIL